MDYRLVELKNLVQGFRNNKEKIIYPRDANQQLKEGRVVRWVLLFRKLCDRS